MKITHPTLELVVSHTVNHEKHLLRELSDTGASISMILKIFTSENVIRKDEWNKKP
jgi:hypothetical protein